MCRNVIMSICNQIKDQCTAIMSSAGTVCEDRACQELFDGIMADELEHIQKLTLVLTNAILDVEEPAAETPEVVE